MTQETNEPPRATEDPEPEASVTAADEPAIEEQADAPEGADAAAANAELPMRATPRIRSSPNAAVRR